MPTPPPTTKAPAGWPNLVAILGRLGFEHTEAFCCYATFKGWRGFCRYCPDVATGPKYVLNLVARPGAKLHLEAEAHVAGIEDILAATAGAWRDHHPTTNPTTESNHHG